jgi:phage baseplate assembly protein W
MDNGKLFYGKSLGFPPRVGPDGRLVWSSGEENVRESICIILRTKPGERLQLPDFGCGLDDYLFEPNNVGNLRLIQEAVKQALTRWEPRVKLDDVRVALNAQDPQVVDITIFYTLIATQKRERVNLAVTV